MLLNLEKGSMVTVELRHQDCQVQCRKGRVWITIAGDPRDYFLEGVGERLIAGPGKMVIEAIEGACLGMHSESELTLEVNEDYCAAAGSGPRGSALETGLWPFQSKPGTLLVQAKLTSV